MAPAGGHALVASDLELRVAGLSGEVLCTMQVAVEEVWSVRDAKVAIAASTGLSAGEVRLLFGLRELRDREWLHDVLPVDVAELTLIRRPREVAQWLERFEHEGVFELRGAPETVRSDRDLVLAAVAGNGLTLEYASPELKADRTVVTAAVRHDGCALLYAARELWSDREVIRATASQDGWCALQFASGELRNDPQVVLEAVAHDGRALRFASPELQADRAVVLTAVHQRGRALQHAAPELQADLDVVRTAVAQDGWHALQYAAEDLRVSSELVDLADSVGSRS